MKTPRTPRFTPRTLSADVPPMLRVPSTSHNQTRFPSLSVVLAGAALAPGCHEPVCGTDRADELQAHGSEGVRALRNGEGSRAVKEIGVALGLRSHTSTTPTMEVGGALPIVQPVPPPPVPVVPQTPLPTAGAPMMVDPTPVRPQPPGPTTTRPHSPGRGGAVRPVLPHSIPRPSRGERAPTTPQPPRPPPQLEGDTARIGPLPAQQTLRHT
jgi:hypothetical protein